MPRIALGQVNLTVGDLDGNVARMADAAARATQDGADVIAFPELAITGYPPEDLVHRGEFIRENLESLDALARKTATSCPVVAGFIDRTDAGAHNAAALLRNGTVETRYHKMQLPNFGVFDEERYFVPGTSGTRIEIGGLTIGLSVCEDAWHDAQPFASYAGLSLILNINGSPYHRGKTAERAEILAARARQTGAWIAYVNAVGGQDELVFDGGPMMVAPDGSVRHRATMFGEDLLIVDLHGDTSFADPRPPWPTDDAEEVWQALVLGLGDYAKKNGFREAVLGLSGASTPRSPPRSRSTRWGPMPCTRSPCRRPTARPRASRTPSTAPLGSGCASTPWRSRACSTPTATRSPSCSPARPRTSPRRTCRPASAATC